MSLAEIKPAKPLRIKIVTVQPRRHGREARRAAWR